jgi:hypothetical protein
MAPELECSNGKADGEACAATPQARVRRMTCGTRTLVGPRCQCDNVPAWCDDVIRPRRGEGEHMGWAAGDCDRGIRLGLRKGERTN